MYRREYEAHRGNNTSVENSQADNDLLRYEAHRGSNTSVENSQADGNAINDSSDSDDMYK